MQIGMVGLGRMGANMLRRLANDGHECVGYDLSEENTKAIQAEGMSATTSLDEFVSMLKPPRIAWCMVPHGTKNSTVKGDSPALKEVRHLEKRCSESVHHTNKATALDGEHGH